MLKGEIESPFNLPMDDARDGVPLFVVYLTISPFFCFPSLAVFFLQERCLSRREKRERIYVSGGEKLRAKSTIRDCHDRGREQSCTQDASPMQLVRIVEFHAMQSLKVCLCVCEQPPLRCRSRRSHLILQLISQPYVQIGRAHV